MGEGQGAVRVEGAQVLPTLLLGVVPVQEQRPAPPALAEEHPALAQPAYAAPAKEYAGRKAEEHGYRLVQGYEQQVEEPGLAAPFHVLLGYPVAEGGEQARSDAARHVRRGRGYVRCSSKAVARRPVLPGRAAHGRLGHLYHSGGLVTIGGDLG